MRKIAILLILFLVNIKSTFSAPTTDTYSGSGVFLFDQTETDIANMLLTDIQLVRKKSKDDRHVTVELVVDKARRQLAVSILSLAGAPSGIRILLNCSEFSETIETATHFSSNVPNSVRTPSSKTFRAICRQPGVKDDDDEKPIFQFMLLSHTEGFDVVIFTIDLKDEVPEQKIYVVNGEKPMKMTANTALPRNR